MWHADVHELCRSLLELEAMRWGTPPMRPACSACEFAQRWDSLSTLSPVCLLQGQIARRTISVQTEQAERGIQSHPTEHPPTLPPPPFPNIVHPFSLPPFIISFILRLHLCKSLHFRCIHTFSVSLCMSFPPSLLLLLTSLCPSFPPFFLFSPLLFLFLSC